MRISRLIALVVAAVVVGGCGGNSPSPSSTGTTSATPSLSATQSSSSEPSQVKGFIDDLKTGSDAALRWLEPRTAAYAYVQSYVGIMRARHLPVAVTPTDNGYSVEGAAIWSDFQVNDRGRITTFITRGEPVDRLVVPGDGRTYRSTDGKLTMSVICFRHFDLNGMGNVSVVMSASNSSTKAGSVDTVDYVANGKHHPEVVQPNPVPAKARNLMFPNGLGAVPDGAVLTVKIGANPGTIVKLPIPSFP